MFVPKRRPYLLMCAFVILWGLAALFDVIAPFSLVGTVCGYVGIVCALTGARLAMRATVTLERDHAGLWQFGITLASTGLLTAMVNRLWLQTPSFSEGWLNSGILLALPAASVPVIFWLMLRFSNIDWHWARIGIRSVGFFVAAAGGMIYLAGVQVWNSPFGAVFIVVAMAIFASHAFRALSDRNDNVTLSGSWIGVCVVLWIAGFGVLGAMMTGKIFGVFGAFVPALLDLVQWGLFAIGAACANQIAADARGLNARVTGYSALWLVLFGVLIAGLGEAMRGIGRAEFATALDTVAQVGRIAAMMGVIVYAIQFFARRPRIRSESL